MEADEPIRRDELILIRPVTKSDLGFVVRTWIESLRYGNDLFREIPEHTLFENYKKFIGQIIEKPSTVITIASLRDEPGLIIGFAVGQGTNILHYVYVREPWRKLGLARDLVPRETKYVTHLTFTGMAIKRKKNLIFDPFKI